MWYCQQFVKSFIFTSISVFCVNTARDVVTVLLIFAKYLSLYLHIFTCTYRGTHTQAHMYNQHTRGMATTRHKSLVERGGRKALLEALHTHKQIRKKNVRNNPIFTNPKKRFEHIELPAKLLDYFWPSNKSNINQISICKSPHEGMEANQILVLILFPQVPLLYLWERKRFLYIKNDESWTSKYPETRNSCSTHRKK